MPAIITHDFFGRDVYDALFQTIGGSRDEADAFLLGNQGPDPLFYAVADFRATAYHKLGNTMHSRKPAELLAALKDSLGVLDPEEKPLGRAYALGFLCHYALDSAVHPLVYCHEHALCDAGEPGLTRDDGGEVHGVIESELDEMVLFTKRGDTVAAFNPSREILHASEAVLGAVSKMYAYLALNVYGEVIPHNLFRLSVHGFRLVQRLFWSPTGIKRDLIGRIERLARPHSFYQSMSHRPVATAESVFDNHEHAAWTNPFTGDVRTTGFWDLYDQAQYKAKNLIAAFDQPGFTAERTRELTDELDFSGRPTQAQVLAVE